MAAYAPSRTLLTPRQSECLALVREGLSSPEIGRRLGLSPHTVNEHVKDACARLGVRSRAQAVAEAAKRGLISL